MAYSLPVFNLTCNIFTGPWLARVLRLESPSNLALGRRVSSNNGDLAGQLAYGLSPILLLPPLTDIRDGGSATGYDVVEVPVASGRFYAVAVVDDIGKGFFNEHRYAQVVKAVQVNDSANFPGAFWPTPIP